LDEGREEMNRPLTEAEARFKIDMYEEPYWILAVYEKKDRPWPQRGWEWRVVYKADRLEDALAYVEQAKRLPIYG